MAAELREPAEGEEVAFLTFLFIEMEYIY